MTIIVTMTIISNNELVIFYKPIFGSKWMEDHWNPGNNGVSFAECHLHYLRNKTSYIVIYTNSITNSFHSEIFRFISS